MKINYQKDKYLSFNKSDNAMHKVKKHISIESRENDKTRPARAISFSGSVSSLGEKFVKSAPINKAIDFVWDNEAAYNAIYSLVIAGMIKPMLVLNSKGSEEKDKQIIATKNFIQAFIGSFLNFTIGGGLIKKSVDIIKNNLKLITVDENNNLNVVPADSKKALEMAEDMLIKEHKSHKSKVKMLNEENGKSSFVNFFKAFKTKLEYNPTQEEIKEKASKLVETCSKHKRIFDTNPKFVKEILSKAKTASGTSLYEAYEVFWKNSAGTPITIGKAKISSILLPVVVGLIFANKNNKKKTSTLLNSKQYNEEIKNYKPFNGEGKENNNVSFKGAKLDKVIDGFAQGVEKISLTKPGEACARTLSKFKKPSPRMGDLESFLLTFYWLYNTSKSKKIDPDQKLGLNIQTALVTIVSSLLALGIDKLCDKPIDNAQETFKKVLSEDVNQINNIMKDASNTKDLKTVISEQCSNLAGNVEITRKLSKTDLHNEAEVESAIKSLSGSYAKQLSKFKSLTIFTFVVRLLVPVLMVPVGGKIKKYYKERKANNDTQATNETQKK